MGIGWVPGVEISVSWGDTTLHIVGLGIDPSALRTTLLSWKVQRVAEAGSTGVPTPHAKKVYRLHLRTKRTGGVR